MGMSNENLDAFRYNVKYSSLTFLKYAKLVNIRDQNTLFLNYELDKINKKYTPEISKSEKKYKIVDKKYQISKKMKKKLKTENKFILLKKNANRPDKIRIYDTRSNYSFTLMNIKDMQKSIPVPLLWKTKKKYLLGNKGNENSDIFLKLYTGIDTKIKKGFRNFKSVSQFLNKKTLFKNYLKFGEYYYEGKNLEKNLEKYCPGTISDNLRNALGISLFSNPPWVINYKKFGLPPSYFTISSDIKHHDFFIINVNDIQLYYNLKLFAYWGEF